MLTDFFLNHCFVFADECEVFEGVFDACNIFVAVGGLVVGVVVVIMLLLVLHFLLYFSNNPAELITAKH